LDQALPTEASISRDEFMEATTDVWEMPPESAKRVGHPAPFPIELPERLIHLYTFRGDLVLDPFMGSGTTAVAAFRTDRRYAGYDTDPAYVDAAQARVERERQRTDLLFDEEAELRRVVVPRGRRPVDETEDFPARAVRDGRAARDLAREALERSGFTELDSNVSLPEGVEVSFRGVDQGGTTWHVDVAGGFTSNRPGLRRSDTLWKALGKAAVLHEAHPGTPHLLLTTELPSKKSAAAAALAAVTGPARPIHDVIVLSSAIDLLRLKGYGAGTDRADRAPGEGPQAEKSTPAKRSVSNSPSGQAVGTRDTASS
jgi:site-specific DNA-methyltransferase (adenine-specific)